MPDRAVWRGGSERTCRHSRASGNPWLLGKGWLLWVPAFAGMTMGATSAPLEFRRGEQQRQRVVPRAGTVHGLQCGGLQQRPQARLRNLGRVRLAEPASDRVGPVDPA